MNSSKWAVAIENIVGWICIAFMFHSCVTARADSIDPNMQYDAPVAGEYTDLPTKSNVDDIKAIFKDIRKLYKHPDAQWLHLHKKERNIIKQNLPENPSLTIFLR